MFNALNRLIPRVVFQDPEAGGVIFTAPPAECGSDEPPSSEVTLKERIAELAEALLTSPAFDALTLGRLHVLVHESGHALAGSLQGCGQATIHIHASALRGTTTFLENTQELTPIQNSLQSLAGPLVHVVCSLSAISGAEALADGGYLPEPLKTVFLVWAVATNVIWLFGEIYYAISSAISGKGDFGDIRANGGAVHLTVSGTILSLPILLALTS